MFHVYAANANRGLESAGNPKGRFLIAAAYILCSNAAWAQVPFSTTLELDVENIVSYASDVFDASKFATDPNRTTATPVRNFRFVMAIGDLVAVNGKPAKGALVARQQAVALTPIPSQGQGVADVTATAVTEFLFEIQQADGSSVGNIHTLTLSGGATPAGFTGGATVVGAPFEGNHVVVGGTGAYLGVRGQGASVVLPGNTGPRSASMTEDPAGRRAHGGGKVHFVYQLIPMTRPEIVGTPNGPAVTHSNDFSLVTAAKPAKAGEILSLFATGLGPTRPAVEIGKPFPANPLAVVNSPMQVTVDGQPAEIVGAVGYPGAVDGYQVNFRVPADVTPGTRMIQMGVAWIPGAEVGIAVQ
jgi:uncharacterized protein (TIGR03437 family)